MMLYPRVITKGALIHRTDVCARQAGKSKDKEKVKVKNKMAIYHASFKIIGRSSGRSSTAAAAYRAGEKIVDQRTGEIHDYTRRNGVDAAFILAPGNAPKWAYDRSKLWNAVEFVEKRKDAQLCRELNVAVPIELDQQQARQLVTEYVQSSFVEEGMIADVCFHDMESDNPHAHIMLTMRTVDREGFGKKNRDWNAKKLLKEWRVGWEKAANQHLKVAGHQQSIDCRTLEEQGIERPATVHLGPHASAMENRGVETDLGNYNRMATKLGEALARLVITIEKRATKVKSSVLDAKDTILKQLEKAGGSVIGAAVQQKESTNRIREARERIAQEKRKVRAITVKPTRGPSFGR